MELWPRPAVGRPVFFLVIVPMETSQKTHVIDYSHEYNPETDLPPLPQMNTVQNGTEAFSFKALNIVRMGKGFGPRERQPVQKRPE